ncbi:MAG: hypothetical protein K2R98_31670 [Gemmataceae bacterium]|nr:hypothetical protein [Gemmataceae bacterium]
MIAFACPRCQTRLQLNDAEAGEKLPCPSCGQRLRVPTRTPTHDHTLIADVLPVRTSEAARVPAALTASTAATLRCICPHCRTMVTAPHERAGSVTHCPRCHFPFEVPFPPAPTVSAPVVVNVLTSAMAAAPSTAAAWAAHERLDGAPHQPRPSGRSAAWTAVFAFLLIVVAGGFSILWLSEQGPFKPKPQQRILGRWQYKDERNPKEKAILIFYKDGMVAVVPPSGIPSPDKGRYRFIDDTTMETTGTAGSGRMQVSFPSADELVWVMPDGERVKLRRLK